MSPTISLGEDDYRICAFRAASTDVDVDTTPRSGAQSVKAGLTPPLSDVPSSLPDPAAVRASNRRESSIVHQLTAWLSLEGFRTGSKLPAVFQKDTEAPRSGSADLSNTDTVAVEKALVKRALARHDQAYICGLRRDIFTNLLDHARHMVGHHTVSKRDQSDSASRGNEPTRRTYTIEDEDLQCVVAHVVRVMETLHHATMLSTRSRDGQVEKAGLRRNTLDSTAILPKSLKKGPDTATSINLPESHITPVTSAGPMSMSGLQPLVGATGSSYRDKITRDTETNPADVRADSGGRGEGEAACASISTSTSLPPEASARTRPTTEPQAEAPSGHAATGGEPQITSFPALRKRQCTSDWLIPPAATPGLKEVASEGDLYSFGIDAHPGPSASHVPQPSIRKPWPTLSVEAGKMSFRTPSYSAEAGEQPVEAAPNMGASSGASSGRKLSRHNRIQVPGSSPETPTRHSSIFHKLGLGSAFIPGVGTSRGPQNTPQKDIVRRSSSAEMMKAILGTKQGETSTRRDTVVFSGSHVGRQSRPGPVDTCSEDGRPHLCTDDACMSSCSVAGQDF
jgi:hypothetical protein